MNASKINIRTSLHPGDREKIIQLHRELYADEYGYGIGFEAHVIAGLQEFINQYDPQKDRIWICEDGPAFAGSLLLMHRNEETAQLRFFVLNSAYRGQGIGNKLMELFIDFLKAAGYTKAYLWTTSELHAAAKLYTKYGFRLTEEVASSAFGKQVTEQRYDLNLNKKEHPANF